MTSVTLPFDGSTFDEQRDGVRLTSQYERVFRLMSDGQWRTLTQIATFAEGSAAAVSARLRDMRKAKFGGHTVERRYIGLGTWEYRLIVNHGEVPPVKPRRKKVTREQIAEQVHTWMSSPHEHEEHLIARIDTLINGGPTA